MSSGGLVKGSGNLYVYAGIGSEDIAAAVAKQCGGSVITTIKQGVYADGHFFARGAKVAIDEHGKMKRVDNIRFSDVIVIAPRIDLPKVTPDNVLVMTSGLIQMFKDEGARSVRVIIPCLPYQREDRELTDETVAIMVKTAIGIINIGKPDGVLLVDAHEPRIKEYAGWHARPDIVHASALFMVCAKSIVEGIGMSAERFKIIAPDKGGWGRAKACVVILTKTLGIDVDDSIPIIDKVRISATQVAMRSFAGVEGFEGAVAGIPDDIIAGGTTMAQAAEVTHALLNIVFATHATLTPDKETGLPNLLKYIDGPNPALNAVLITDSLVIPPIIGDHPRVWKLPISELVAVGANSAWFIDPSRDHQSANGSNGISAGIGSLTMVNYGHDPDGPSGLLNPHREPPARLLELLRADLVSKGLQLNLKL